MNAGQYDVYAGRGGGIGRVNRHCDHRSGMVVLAHNVMARAIVGVVMPHMVLLPVLVAMGVSMAMPMAITAAGPDGRRHQQRCSSQHASNQFFRTHRNLLSVIPLSCTVFTLVCARVESIVRVFDAGMQGRLPVFCNNLFQQLPGQQTVTKIWHASI